MTFIQRIILFLFFFNAAVFTQAKLEVTLSTDNYEYNERDSVKLTLSIKNISDDTLVVLDKGGFDVLERCFSAYDYGENLLTGYADERWLTDFKTLNPGEEASVTKPVTIGWLCRSMGPTEDYEVTLNYLLNVATEDNYYLLMYATGEKKKIHFDAWIGRALSNNVTLKIKKPVNK